MTSGSVFWDASGIVLLCLAQPEAARAKRLQKLSKQLVVWWGTPVEATSAFERIRREAGAPAAECDRALARLEAVSLTWIEVQPVEHVRVLARHLLEEDPLRAADALQLAAALVWTKERPRNRVFVTFDQRLGHVAARHGFAVRPEFA